MGISCAQRYNHLFDIDKTNRSAGEESIRNEFIFKIPVENKLDGDKSISVLKEKVHILVELTSKTISHFQNLLKSIREK